jgi:hypothetical protein
VDELVPVEINLGLVPVVVRPANLDYALAILHLAPDDGGFVLYYAAYVRGAASTRVEVEDWPETAAGAVIGGVEEPHEAEERLARFLAERAAAPGQLLPEVCDGRGRIYDFRSGSFSYEVGEDGWIVDGSWHFEPELPASETTLRLRVAPADDE